MLDFTFNRTRPSAATLKKIKLKLEEIHHREISESEANKVSDFLYLMADMSVGQLLKEEKWKSKLKDFPKGYAFETKGYTCRLCWDGGSDVGMWYDQYGLKCMHCQKAVESGLLPGELTGDHEGYYTDYDLKSLFNVDGKTLTRWLKGGIIKARNIPRFDNPGYRYKRLFLMIDNKAFLPPKEMLKFSDTATEEIDGKTVEHHLKWYQCCDPFEYLKDYQIMKHMRRTDPKNPPLQQEVKRKAPEQKLCSPTTFLTSFENKYYRTKKRRVKRKKTD